MLPHEIKFALHVSTFAVDRDDGVVFGHDERELAERAVAAKRVVRAAPELIAVALQPVVLFVRAARLRGLMPMSS